ncbi:PPE domain-containing protein [Nocardia alni]|uniref:PPE domain-containing protein n=1 Tax=Nocardia alni TaxID=2815723 RepID=UPI001C2278EE|nr:PPE domain-containing protein [Nocardia alni]
MVAGITGVLWEVRPVEMMSTQLDVGAHAIPIAAAEASWTGLAGAWTDATATLTRVMAELGIGMLGANGIAAAAQLTAFTGWAGEQTAMAAGMAVKAAANATAYTVASLVMPSAPEIAAVDAARVAAHATGGDLTGDGEAAEATYAEMQARAALVMETYEAATSLMVATPAAFMMPPPISVGAGLVSGAMDIAEAAQGDINPVAQAVSSAQAAVANPATAQAATQVAGVGGSVVSSAVPAAGDLAGSTITAATGGTTTMSPTMGGMFGGAAMGGTALTGSMSFSPGSVGIGGGAGSLQIPEGWGGGLGNALPSVGGAPAEPMAPTTPAGLNAEPAQTRPTVNTGNPLMGNQAQEEDEDYHDSSDLLNGEYFADGRIIASGVIGGDPNAEAR